MQLGPNPAAVAYRGAAVQSALALQLPKHITEMGNKALETLTNALPLIEGLDRIAGIGVQHTPIAQGHQPHHGGVPSVAGGELSRV